MDYCLRTSKFENQNCTSNSHCPSNQECIFTSTGEGFCVCPRGFNHLSNNICEDVNECIEYSRTLCAKNSSCINLQGSYECQCLPGYEGDPYREGCILPIQLKHGCNSDFDCPLVQKCDISSGECFDPCFEKGKLKQKCGQNAICKTENHHSECICASGYEGNPYKTCYQRISCGIDYHCPGNLVCLGNNVCGCLPNYIRENDYCIIESTNCTTSNPCPQNLECVYTGSSSGFCVCPHGFELHDLHGDLRCVDIDECVHVHCGSGATCENKPGSYECSCPVDTIGDPYVKGCVEIDGCRLHEDCANDRECDFGSKQCISKFTFIHVTFESKLDTD